MAFGGEHTGEYEIEERRGERVVFGAAKMQRILYDANTGDRRKQQRVEIIAANFVETRDDGQVDEARLRIAPEMMMPAIVFAPQECKGRHGGHDTAARLQHATQGGEAGAVVGKVLQYVERGHQIE